MLSIVLFGPHLSQPHTGIATMTEEYSPVRLDKWLWAARFFKTRALAAQAIQGGKVHVNGQRCKASRLIAPGDQLEIQRGQEKWEVIVRDLSMRRGPAREAAQLFEETGSSFAAREAVRAERKLAHPVAPEKRPDRRQRQSLRTLRRQR